MKHISIDYAIPTAALISGLYVSFALRPEEMGETTKTLRLQTRYPQIQSVRTLSSSTPTRHYSSRRTIFGNPSPRDRREAS